MSGKSNARLGVRSQCTFRLIFRNGAITLSVDATPTFGAIRAYNVYIDHEPRRDTCRSWNQSGWYTDKSVSDDKPVDAAAELIGPGRNTAVCSRRVRPWACI
jgi:hypothetical protein